MATPSQNVLDPRRWLRLPARCQVDVRHRFSRFQAQTEDVSPQGCQLVTPRLVATGRDVRLAIQVPELGRAVEGQATVVWSRAAEPSRLGLRFSPERGDRAWFEALLAADPILAAAARRRILALPPRARLYLGRPPTMVVDFTRDELAVLQRVRQGMAVAELVASFGKTPERLVGALFALVARRQVVLDPRQSPGSAEWREVLARAEAASAAEGLTPEPRLVPSAVHRLMREGRDHLAAGRVALAAARFREAQALAPDDPAVQAALRELGPFA